MESPRWYRHIAILHGRPTGTPMAFETHFGWVLAGDAPLSEPARLRWLCPECQTPSSTKIPRP